MLSEERGWIPAVQPVVWRGARTDTRRHGISSCPVADLREYNSFTAGPFYIARLRGCPESDRPCSADDQ